MKGQKGKWWFLGTGGKKNRGEELMTRGSWVGGRGQEGKMNALCRAIIMTTVRQGTLMPLNHTYKQPNGRFNKVFTHTYTIFINCIYPSFSFTF